MLEFWQNLPYQIDPVIFKIGGFKVSWYWVMYLVGFSVVLGLTKFRLKKQGKNKRIQTKIFDLLFWMFLAAIIGGRLGYTLFYGLEEFMHNPIWLINPFTKTADGNWVYQGIYGMSYHGGLLGALIGAWIYTKKNKLNFLKILDYLIPSIALGYTFGRIGNFLNGELYGRETDFSLGMYFPKANITSNQSNLRHPSQLYEALFEGLIVFIILWNLRKKITSPGVLSALYLIFYGSFRFLIEFVREPDSHLGLVFLNFTMGQVLCSGMIIAGILMIIYLKNSDFFKKKVKKFDYKSKFITLD
ncbi:MAG: prolipoprotein diacylglyceryl transferase [Candidatus Moranbacteria bacterium]|nr:prolipoprotein diacylglyceryl transferase [Candidatus Moranbacteria bacterium]